MGEGREGGRSGMTTSGKSSRYKKRGKRRDQIKKNGRGMVVRSGVWGKGGDEKKKKNRNKGRLGDFADC